MKINWIHWVAAVAVLWGATAAWAADAAREIRAFKAVDQSGSLVVTLQTAGAWDFSAVQILIDTDGSSATGWSGVEGIGADMMIEGENIFRFEGNDQSSWSWTQAAKATRTVRQNELQLTVAPGVIPAGKLRVVARTLTDNWQSAVSQWPKNGPLDVEVKAAQQAPLSLSVKQDGTDLLINMTAAQASDFDTCLIFFDSDNDAKTGYCPPADQSLGVDMLIQGEGLMKFAGKERNAWEWSPVATVGRKIDGGKMEIRLNASYLGGQTVGVSAWVMSADWQSVVNRAPTKNLEVIKIDGAKLKSLQARKTVEFAPPKENRDLPVRQRVAKAKSFYCYYGKERVEELSYYDVVILHSPEFAPEKIKKLKELGVVTIGYITVGEDDKLRTGNGKGPGGYASWYFERDQAGKPDRNSTWNSYFANAADPEWRADRVAEAKRLISEDGYDGIFLDTLDTVERYKESYDGMVQLVQEFRKAMPDAPIILNQGYTLLPRLAPFCDGLMLESFTSTYDFSSKQYMLNYPGSLDFHLMRMKRDVLPILAKHPIPVFVLDYALPSQRENIQTAANRAASFGFLFAAAPIFLDDVYVDMPTGKPDPKWLEKIATPESMSLLLKQPANGFPAGTRIVPSGCFAGYTVEPLIDGIADRAPLHWSKAAWASAEDGEAPWLEVRLPAVRTGGQFVVDFYKTVGERYLSREFVIEARSADGQWMPAAVTLQDMQAFAALPAKPYTAIRVRQPANGGSAERPNLMWLSQIALK